MESIANRPVRRIVTADGADGRSLALSDGAVDDVLRDPARRGYQSTRVWATDRTPAVALTAQAVAHLPGLLEPPPGGALFRIVTIPPDAVWESHVSLEAAHAFLRPPGRRMPGAVQVHAISTCSRAARWSCASCFRFAIVLLGRRWLQMLSLADLQGPRLLTSRRRSGPNGFPARHKRCPPSL